MFDKIQMILMMKTSISNNRTSQLKKIEIIIINIIYRQKKILANTQKNS